MLGRARTGLRVYGRIRRRRVGLWPQQNRGCRIERTGLTSDTNGDPIPALRTRLSVPDYGHPCLSTYGIWTQYLCSFFRVSAIDRPWHGRPGSPHRGDRLRPRNELPQPVRGKLRSCGPMSRGAASSSRASAARQRDRDDGCSATLQDSCRPG